jgi:hypothetical protein
MHGIEIVLQAFNSFEFTRALDQVQMVKLGWSFRR